MSPLMVLPPLLLTRDTGFANRPPCSSQRVVSPAKHDGRSSSHCCDIVAHLFKQFEKKLKMSATI